MMRIAAGALLFLVTAAQAQDGSPDKTIRAWMTDRAKELEKDFLPTVKTSADFEKLRPGLHQQYMDMLGLWPVPEKTPLNAKVTGTYEDAGVRVEKLQFQSRPGLYVTANLYLPNPAKGPYPAILYSIGHYRGGRDGHKTQVSDQGLWFASHGYVALLYDTIELGEVNCTHHGTYSEKRWWWHSNGFTPAGVECWNAIRAIDYLQSRPEVDKDRIGATGISGGGAATFWISAADDRVKASAPVSGMADLTWYIGEDGVNGHCDCMFLYNNYRWNWTTIAGLICPRPLLFTNSDADTIFPMPANERVINRLERLYSKFGESDKVDAMVSVGSHAMRTDLRRAIFEFFNRHLKGELKRVEDADMGLGADGKVRIPGPSLRVFAEDKDIPADQRNTKIDESFVTLAKPTVPTPEKFVAWKTDIITRLTVAGVIDLPKAAIPLVKQKPLPSEANGRLTYVVLNPTDDFSKGLPAWAEGATRPQLFQPPTGWTLKSPPNTVERSLALRGMTVDSLRVAALVRAIEEQNDPVRVIAKGDAAVIAAYAALFCPKIEALTLIDPPASHHDGPKFLGVLKICDIPEALGCLAPRPLTLVDAKDASFDRTAELYKVAGAADRLVRK
jgi:dienelactone hydrolase